jgi:hypothetical protein
VFLFGQVADDVELPADQLGAHESDPYFFIADTECFRFIKLRRSEIVLIDKLN